MRRAAFALGAAVMAGAVVLVIGVAHGWWRGTAQVPLRPKAFAVLHYLVVHAPQLVTQAEVLQAVWGDASVSEGLLRGYIRDLRAALGDEAQAPRFIATVARRGWRFRTWPRPCA